MLASQIDRFLTICSLRNDVVSFLSKNLGKIHSDQRFVFGDQDSWSEGCMFN